MGERYDAIVVGSGPNGLAAAITLAQAGKSVVVYEGAASPGGGLRTEELVEPGFRHDICSTIMSLPPLLSFFAPLGLDLITPPAPLAHPQDDGTAIVVEQSVAETADKLGGDAGRYRLLMTSLADHIEDLLPMILGRPRPPRHPFLLARFGLPGLMSAQSLARVLFREREARALIAGVAAHSVLALDELGTGAYGLVLLASAHASGWPVGRRGSGSVADAMIRRLKALGGDIELNRHVASVEELPPHNAALLDLSTDGVLEVAGGRFPESYRRRLARVRRGPGVFKMDWTLDEPIPWRSAECVRAGTVHLGGTMEEIAESEMEVARGRHPNRPFVLLVQPTLFDRSRAPDGKHTAWAYCHVPNGSDVDMTRAIEDQIERFAPGFRGVVRRRSALTANRLESIEPNCTGGQIMGGPMDLRGLIARPVLRLNPYRTPDPQLFICSASTPPGGGVHGMCGVNAARVALRSRLR
jgi:phytoene dehydrogenase-like protein